MYQRHPYPIGEAGLQGAIAGATLGQTRVGALAEQAEQPKRAPQVPEAIGRLTACIEDLNGAMRALSARIDPVLRPIDHTAAGHGAAVPVPVRCVAAGQIEDQCDQLCFITANLRDILERLEV